MAPAIGTAQELDRASAARIKKQISFEIGRFRRVRQLTQEKLAGALHFQDGAQISKIERGHANLSYDAASRLDKLGELTSLGLSFTQLLEALDRAEARDPKDPQLERQVDLFLASPMASTLDDATYRAERKSARDVSKAFHDHCGLSVYYAGRDIESKEEFEVPELAAKMNFAALRDAKYFVLLLLEPLASRPSSIWVETGYALARGKPSLLLAPEPQLLPFMLQTISQHHLPELLPPVIYQPVATVEQTIALIRNQGRRLLAELDQLADG